MIFEYFFELFRCFGIILILIGIFSSGKDKLFKSQRKDPSIKLMLRLLEKMYVPIIIVVFSTLSGIPNYQSIYFGCVILLIMIGLNFLLNLKGIINECECFGGVQRDFKIRTRFLFIFLFVDLILMMLFATMLDRSYEIKFGFTATAILLAILISNYKSILFYHFYFFKSDSANNSVESYFEPQTSVTLNGELITISTEAGERTALKDLEILESQFVLIGLTEDCEDCSQSKSILFDFSNAFSKHIKIIFILNRIPLSNIPSNINCIIEGTDSIFEELGHPGFPFAMMFNTKNRVKIGPTVVTSNNIWRFLFQVLIHLNRKI